MPLFKPFQMIRANFLEHFWKNHNLPKTGLLEPTFWINLVVSKPPKLTHFTFEKIQHRKKKFRSAVDDCTPYGPTQKQTVLSCGSNLAFSGLLNPNCVRKSSERWDENTLILRFDGVYQVFRTTHATNFVFWSFRRSESIFSFRPGMVEGLIKRSGKCAP